MQKLKLALIGTVAMWGCTFSAHASVQATVPAQLVFYDNFDDNVSGRNDPPVNWLVTNGTVDVVGNGDLDYLPGNGLYVDLDGTSFQAGQLRTSFQLEEGITYVATYRLAGSQREDLAPQFGGSITDTVDVTFGSSMQSHTLQANDPVLTFEQIFTPSTSSFYDLTFDNQGGDLIGALLMEVTVATIPEPATTGTMALGLVALMGVLRSRQRPRQ